ncbi:hypothetical protein [Weissella cibaria]|uniref:Uncharacterized protein n=1 Tax=Weissella cibaria TaxID=137591 RepID=A0A0D1M6T5_9LACO|nr:hypothetical protein [Weissella cibaria]KIU23771.1 hypothetical protein ab3b_01348 [Weissella cibaria]
MILDLPNRISGADDTAQQIYQAFYDVGMITDMPTPMKTLNISEYNEQAFSEIESALILLKTHLNRLVDIFNEYHFVDMEGRQAKGHEYWGSDLSGLGESYTDFNKHLVAMENTLRNMVEIMVLNGLIERN